VFNELDSGDYEVKVRATDRRGNTNLVENIRFEVQIEENLGIILLDSVNTKVSTNIPLSWHSSSSNPILRFSTLRNISSCQLSPGIEQGYIGSTYQFTPTGSNIFELDLNSQTDFEIKNGNQRVEISCFREDLNETRKVDVFLNYGVYVPDYTLDINWDRTQIINPGEDSKEIEFYVNQKSYFKDVTCDISFNGASSALNNLTLEENYDGEIGKVKGIMNLVQGTYTLNVQCETPLGIEGPLKEYNFEVIDEEFNVELLSMNLASDSSIQADVSTIPIIIQDPRNSGGSQTYEVQFRTNYQTELVCEVETTETGILNYIRRIFSDDSVYMFPQEFGVYSATVQITEDTSNMRVSCNKGTEFSSGDFYFSFEFLDSNLYSVNVLDVVPE